MNVTTKTLVLALGLTVSAVALAVLTGCGPTPEAPPAAVIPPTARATPLPATVPPPLIPHDLEGRDNCVMCHQLGTVGAPIFPADHAGQTSDTCRRCHVAVAQEMALAVGAKIPQIPHDLIGRDDCLMCHKLGLSGAPRVPDDHDGRPSTVCRGCHSAPRAAQLGGEEIYAQVCARCHGQNGEGGVGPALNSQEFLSAHTDSEIRQAIAKGRGGSEMLAWGDLGLLSDAQIHELTDFIRGWEATAPSRPVAPATQPISAALGQASRGAELFAKFCSGCHGLNGEKEIGGILLHSEELLASLDDPTMSAQIRDGGKAMPSFHAILTTAEINDLLAFLRSWQTAPTVVGPTATPPPAAPTATPVEARVPSFAGEIMPLLQAKCVACHGSMGGWSAASYEEVVNGGDNGPTVVPGDPESSLLLQKLKGTQTIGAAMPLGGSLSAEDIALVEAWIAAGAPR